MSKPKNVQVEKSLFHYPTPHMEEVFCHRKIAVGELLKLLDGTSSVTSSHTANGRRWPIRTFYSVVFERCWRSSLVRPAQNDL